MRESKLAKWGLGAYFVIFLIFIYGPMIVMAILSLQGTFGNITFPMRGFSGQWWEALANGQHSDEIRDTGGRSLRLGLAVGAIVALLAFSLSMAFRRRFRGDGVLFYLIMLALMTPGILLSLGTSLFWQFLGKIPSLWSAVLGTNVVWGIPFAFLVMVAVWNRYDARVEEAARDLGASTFRTFREVTLPLVWTGLFGSLLFGFTLSWNEYDRTALLVGSGQNTLPVQIFALTLGSVIRPDLYALGTGTTLLSLLVVFIFLVAAGLWLRGRAAAAEEVEEGLAEELAERRDRGEPAGAGARAR